MQTLIGDAVFLADLGLMSPSSGNRSELTPVDLKEIPIVNRAVHSFGEHERLPCAEVESVAVFSESIFDQVGTGSGFVLP